MTTKRERERERERGKEGERGGQEEKGGRERGGKGGVCRLGGCVPSDGSREGDSDPISGF
jgi:hypothetical protein